MVHSITRFARVGRLLATLTLAVVVGGFSSAQTAKADVVVSAGADKKVKIWDPKTGKELKSITAHDSEITALAVSADGKLIASGGADKKVKIWNLAEGVLVKEITAHESAVTALYFAQDGALLASGGADKKVKLWKIPDGKLDATLEANNDKIVGISLITFGDMLIILSGSADGAIPVLGKDGNSLANISTEHKGGLTSLGGNIKETCIYSGGADGVLKFWSQGPNGTFEGGSHTGAINVIHTTADSAKVLTGGADGKLFIWSAADHKKLAEVDTMLKGGVTAVTSSPDGKMIYTGGDKEVKVWDETGKLIATVPAHEGKIISLIYVADKKDEKK